MIHRSCGSSTTAVVPWLPSRTEISFSPAAARMRTGGNAPGAVRRLAPNTTATTAACPRRSEAGEGAGQRHQHPEQDEAPPQAQPRGENERRRQRPDDGAHSVHAEEVPDVGAWPHPPSPGAAVPPCRAPPPPADEDDTQHEQAGERVVPAFGQVGKAVRQPMEQPRRHDYRQAGRRPRERQLHAPRPHRRPVRTHVAPPANPTRNRTTMATNEWMEFSCTSANMRV